MTIDTTTWRYYREARADGWAPKEALGYVRARETLAAAWHDHDVTHGLEFDPIDDEAWVDAPYALVIIQWPDGFRSRDGEIVDVLGGVAATEFEDQTPYVVCEAASMVSEYLDRLAAEQKAGA